MNEREALRRRIHALEFAAWELHLFLDSHPGSCDAARKLEEYRGRIASLKRDFEERFGPIGETPQNTSRYAWISDPWPWDPVCGEGEVK